VVTILTSSCSIVKFIEKKKLFTKGMSKDEAFKRASFNGNEMLARKVFDTISIIA
jgi:hypothetical protein